MLVPNQYLPVIPVCTTKNCVFTTQPTWNAHYELVSPIVWTGRMFSGSPGGEYAMLPLARTDGPTWRADCDYVICQRCRGLLTEFVIEEDLTDAELILDG